MSSEGVSICLEGVSKSFSIYERPHHRLLAMLSRRRVWHRDFHALRDVSLEIRRGECVGVVGRNGSGKSTLLQVICGTLTPTRGTVVAKGRIAALLELGAGFNPEFTGRENVYMNGAVLGLSRGEVDARFDDILAFASIGDFVDQPVKTYSSGMFVRLAFAVAISVDPDILVIDEALAVGDEIFQRKCFARIQSIREAGATVLFVSHSSGTVTELCDRVVLLDAGEVLALGRPKAVITSYHHLLYAPAGAADAIRADLRSAYLDGPREDAVYADVVNGPKELIAEFFDPALEPVTVRYPSVGAEITEARIETTDGRRVNVLRAGAHYVFRYHARVIRDATCVRCGMMIRTLGGLELGGGVSSAHGQGLALNQGAAMQASFRFTCLLAPGTYFLNAGVLGRLGAEEIFLDRQVDAAMFRVMPELETRATGIVDFHVEPAVDAAPADAGRGPAENCFA